MPLVSAFENLLDHSSHASPNPETKCPEILIKGEIVDVGQQRKMAVMSMREAEAGGGERGDNFPLLTAFIDS